MTNDGEQQTHWTLDRRVPVGLLVGLGIGMFAQTGAAMYWAGGFTEQVDGIASQVAQNTAELKAKQADASRIAVTETQINSLTTSINRLNSTMDRLLQRAPATRQGD